MTETFKFPGGNDVKVVRKQDIIECIDCNIVDKEVALAIIQQCEVDAANFLRQGRWTGIPFLGNIRANQIRKLQNTPEQRELIETAYNTVSKEQYVIFRKELAHDNQKRLKANKFFAFRLASSIKRNKDSYLKVCKERGEAYARIRFSFRPSPVMGSSYLDFYAEDSNNR